MDLKTGDGLELIGIFLAFVFPGLLSIQVLRLILPGERLEWKDAIPRGLFYSLLNYAFLSPIGLWVLDGNRLDAHPVWYSTALFVLLVVGPVAWPFLWKAVATSKRFATFAQIPYPTAWDFYFERRARVYVLVHLKNGKLIGGHYGVGAYASSFPRDGDLYLTRTWALDSYGRFLKPNKDSDGLLITKEEYSYLELFTPPQETHDVERSAPQSNTTER